MMLAWQQLGEEAKMGFPSQKQSPLATQKCFHRRLQRAQHKMEHKKQNAQASPHLEACPFHQAKHIHHHHLSTSSRLSSHYSHVPFWTRWPTLS